MVQGDIIVTGYKQQRQNLGETVYLMICSEK